MGTNVGLELGGGISNSETEAESTGVRGKGSPNGPRGSQGPTVQKSHTTNGRVGASVGFTSQDVGVANETARASLDVVNHDVRNAIAAAESAAARSSRPEETFSRELSERILGPSGMRNRYLHDADAGRATFDVTGPLTSIEQNSVLKSGRFSTDIDGSPGDGDSSFKKR